MRRVLVSLAVVLGLAWNSQCATLLAQIEANERGHEESGLPELETDRDAFTPASSTVGYRTTVLETSYSFIDNRNFVETHSFPEVLVRHGVSEWFELRFGWNYEVGGAEELAVGELERESQILYGFKSLLTEQEGWWPRSAVIVQGYTPTSGEATATDVIAAYTFGWELENRWRLDSSIRYGTETTPEDSFNEWAPSVVLRVPLSEQWHAHVEYFGIFSEGAEREFSRSFISPGAHCLLTENLELGVRVGWGISDDAANFFSNVGIGWRF